MAVEYFTTQLRRVYKYISDGWSNLWKMFWAQCLRYFTRMALLIIAEMRFSTSEIVRKNEKHFEKKKENIKQKKNESPNKWTR